MDDIRDYKKSASRLGEVCYLKSVVAKFGELRRVSRGLLFFVSCICTGRALSEFHSALVVAVFGVVPALPAPPSFDVACSGSHCLP